ncbi:unnamed protein product [Oppiella nova]|uniref:Uncharacterized protein n=1 Tax=Oppiella nova TaxID=334625 RepID=A0A7R9M4R4_9ACAR|nr:unnamed protein product [Oppiella nova]CAG2170640.1 unnamed protein product [Oppiella nova]
MSIICKEHGFEITTDFLHYPYVYKFDVKPSEGLDLPPITICTERDVFFDKTPFVRHFNISQKYESYKLSAKQQSNDLLWNMFHYLIDDDFVQFDINYETQQKFLINGYFETNPKKLGKLLEYQMDFAEIQEKLYSSDYFRFYILTSPPHPSHMVSPDEWIHTKRIGLNARLKITTTHFHLLSNPYMKRCLETENWIECETQDNDNSFPFAVQSLYEEMSGNRIEMP